MKRNLTIIFLLVTSSFSFSQEVKIAAVIGPNFTFSSLSKSTKDFYASNYFEPVGATVKTTFPPTVRFQIGALVDYSLDKSFSIRSGILIDLRGFKVKMKGDYTDNSGMSMPFTGKVKMAMTYLEIPVWTTYKIGESGFKIIGGPAFGFAVGGKSSWSVSTADDSGSGSQDIRIGNNARTDEIRPIDISLNLGISREVSLGNNPFEISLYVQPSVSKWNPQTEAQKDYFARHFTGGIRAAYFFSLNK